MTRLCIMMGLIIGIGASRALALEGAAESQTGDISTIKQEVLKQIDERIAALQQARECVNAAADHAALKKCREAQQAAMQGIRQERRENQIKRIEGRQERLEERKKRLQEKGTEGQQGSTGR